MLPAVDIIFPLEAKKLPVCSTEEIVKKTDTVSGLSWDDEGNGLAAVSVVNFKMPV